MSSHPDFSPDVLRQLSDGAASVRTAGDALTKRVKAFEEYIAKLPGRVPAACVMATDCQGQLETYLAIDKDGKGWSLEVYECHVSDDEGVHNRRLLRDCSIHEKASAIEWFPELLRAMVKAQRLMVARATRSASTFDEFAKSIGMKEGA